jgi:MFS family permease
VLTGVAFLPLIACLLVMTNVGNIVLMPRIGPRPLVITGMLLAAAGMALLTRIGVHSSYAAVVLPSLLLIGTGLGAVFGPVINTATFGVPPHDAGVASATVNTGQQLGGSIGTSLLNSIFATAVATFIAAHISAARVLPLRSRVLFAQLAAVHGYHIAFWWSAAIFVGGAIVGGSLMRSGPLTRWVSPAAGVVPEAEVTPGTGVRPGGAPARVR